MATTPSLLTIEEYLRTSYRPDADLTKLTIPNTPIHLDLTEAFAALD